MSRRWVEASAAVYIATSGVGAAIAIADGEPVAFARWNISDGNVRKDFLSGGGTAMSAPLILLLGLVAAVLLTRIGGRIGRYALWLVALMGVCFVAGQAGEPLTYRTLRSPAAHRVRTAVVLGNLTIPAAMSAAAMRASRRGSVR